MILHAERYGNGRPCVFMHGAGGSTLSWHGQKALQDSMEVVLLDLAGHGASPGPAPDTIEGHHEAVLETVEALGLDKPYFAGHSMGGAIAMSLALNSPEKVGGLVLIGTGARLRVTPEFIEGILVDKEKTVRMIIDLAFGRNTPREVKEEGFKAMMKCDAQSIHNDYLACDRFDVMDRVANITHPTLLICALSDLLTPPKYSEFLNQKIKGSEIQLVEGSGHLMMIEKPGEVNGHIRKFVK